jgi:hypothetical protein
MHPGRGTPREPKRVIALRLVTPRVGLEEYLLGEPFDICAATPTTPVREFDGSRAERAARCTSAPNQGGGAYVGLWTRARARPGPA